MNLLFRRARKTEYFCTTPHSMYNFVFAFILNKIGQKRLRYLKLVWASRAGLCPEPIQNRSLTIAVLHREVKGLPFILILHKLQALNSMWTKLHFLVIHQAYIFLMHCRAQLWAKGLSCTTRHFNGLQQSREICQHGTCWALQLHPFSLMSPGSGGADAPCSSSVVLPKYIILMLILEMQRFSCWPD